MRSSIVVTSILLVLLASEIDANTTLVAGHVVNSFFLLNKTRIFHFDSVCFSSSDMEIEHRSQLFPRIQQENPIGPMGTSMFFYVKESSMRGNKNKKGCVFKKMNALSEISMNFS